MNRSLYKGPYVQESLVRKIKKLRSENPDMSQVVIKTYSRKSTILPSFVGLNFDIHNGKRFHKVLINEFMIGKKLGEFSHTRIYAKHTSKKDTMVKRKGKDKKK
ncbi:30S ribosomal protein S19 [bacterium AB1]|nr:30S ribosomal protein S19 [bacterium AB1]